MRSGKYEADFPRDSTRVFVGHFLYIMMQSGAIFNVPLKFVKVIQHCVVHSYSTRAGN